MAMSYKDDYGIEKHAASPELMSVGDNVVSGKGVFSTFKKRLVELSTKLDNIGVEFNGFERVLPWQRESNGQLLELLGMWVSAAGGVTSMSTFFLGPLVYELNFKQCVGYGIPAMIVGCACAAYQATMGAQSGCRQMVTARYLFGWWFVKIVSLASIVGVFGWSVVNCVVSGQMLSVVSNGSIPLWVGILVLPALSLISSVFGIRYVMKSEVYIAIPVTLCWILLYISSSDKYSLLNNFTRSEMSSATIKGNVLTYISLCYSVTSTWGGIASDYYVLLPEDTSHMTIFLFTTFALAIPTTFVGILAIILAMIAKTDPEWNQSYMTYGIAGIYDAGFKRWNGFGKFCVVTLLLSLVSNNILNTYSGAFTVQLASVRLSRIPRWIWAALFTVLFLLCAMIGRNDFSTILENFLPMVGYWTGMYFVMLVEENMIFRTHFLQLYTKEFPPEEEYKSSTNEECPNFVSKANHCYNWNAWKDPNIITNAYASSTAFIIGVVGIILGMAKTYWIGPIAAKFGTYGGDLAMWISMALSAVIFPPLRYFELKNFGR